MHFFDDSKTDKLKVENLAQTPLSLYTVSFCDPWCDISSPYRLMPVRIFFGDVIILA
jgi:hypothetical protein